MKPEDRTPFFVLIITIILIVLMFVSLWHINVAGWENKADACRKAGHIDAISSDGCLDKNGKLVRGVFKIKDNLLFTQTYTFIEERHS